MGPPLIREPARAGEPVPLTQILDEALRKLAQRAQNRPRDGLLFSGNRHESVPRLLLTDRRLTPLERNAWQLFRLHVNDDGISAFPSYEELRPYLSSVPCHGEASDETIARALTVLRLTRWLTLARRNRDARTGRILGNLYVLHDDPLMPCESLQLDADYLSLVAQAVIHASKAIQQVGHQVLKEITQDPLVAQHVLPSRLQLLSRNVLPPSSDSEEGAERPVEGRLRNPKTDCTVRTEDKYLSERTVPRAREALRFSERFRTLRTEQQTAALAALRRVEPSLQQLVLDEWEARCRSTGVRNPAGYLFGIIQRALRGEFRAWAAERVNRD